MVKVKSRNNYPPLPIRQLLLASLALGLAQGELRAATNVSLVGVYSGKALLVVNDRKPQALSVGAKTVDGVKLVSIDEGGSVVIDIEGRRQRLNIGQNAVSTGTDDTGTPQTTLTGDESGHFYATGTVNGAPMKFLVDTGATLIMMSKAEAVRANVDFQAGQPGMAETANGPVRMWKVKLNSVRVGDIVLNQVDAGVQDYAMPMALLGMSFLNRMEMKRDGLTMTPKKRY